MVNLFINPNNLAATIKVKEGNQYVYYFSKEVSDRVP